SQPLKDESLASTLIGLRLVPCLSRGALRHGSIRRSPSATLRFCASFLIVTFASTLLRAGAESTVVGPSTRNASPRQLETVQADLAAIGKKHTALLDGLAQDFTDLGLTQDAKICQELATPLSTALFRIQKPPKEKRGELPPSLPEKERD